jgi:hypothetical protein
VHENQPASPPRSVDELERDTAWTVTRNLPGGRWSTAERTIEQDGHHWRIGLTPVSAAMAALILWRDGAVVAHERGREAALCSTALHWISDLGRR